SAYQAERQREACERPRRLTVASVARRGAAAAAFGLGVDGRRACSAGAATRAADATTACTSATRAAFTHPIVGIAVDGDRVGALVAVVALHDDVEAERPVRVGRELDVEGGGRARSERARGLRGDRGGRVGRVLDAHAADA